MTDSTDSFLELLRKNQGGLSLKRAARLLGISRDEYRYFRRDVLRMLREGHLRRHRGRFLLPRTPRGAELVPPQIRRGRRRRPPLPDSLRGAYFEIASVEAERATGMRELMREFGLPRRFDPATLRECGEVALRDPAADSSRLDMTGVEILCIDPADARDHDDAVSLELLPEGVRRLGVHIADVAEYVDEGGPLDYEARLRGNSTYFYLDTLPMLPPLLSGDTCSLREGVDRPALSVFIDFDLAGKATALELAETRLRVTHSLDYEEAEALIRGEDAAAPAPLLRAMRQLSEQLAEGRDADGALRFELPEIVPVDRGEGVEGFAPVPLLSSHGIVEEFMLAANHAVGGLLARRGLAHLNRVHEAPDPEDLGALSDTLHALGVNWRPGNPVSSRDYQQLARQLARRADREVLLMKLLRSLQKAAYAERDAGHFGLAWREYVHFTSPIRRYADLHAHRILKTLLRTAGGPDRRLRETRIASGRTGAPRDVSHELTALGRQLSDRELNAIKAEREGLKLEMVLWARRRMGESFDAIVLAILPTGLLLRLPAHGVDSFMPAQFLGEEYFRYEEEGETLRGERSGLAFSAGLALRVRLAAASLLTRRMQFFLEEVGKADDNHSQ